MQSTFDWRRKRNMHKDRGEPGAQLASDDGADGAGGNAVSIPRAMFLIVIFALLFVALGARVLYWTLFPADAQADTSPAAVAPADLGRGSIVDRDGILLATDSWAGVVYAHPADIVKSPIGTEVVLSATQALAQPVGALQATLAVTSPVVVLARGVSVGQCDAITRINVAYPGAEGLIWCDFVRERAYPQGTLAAHVLGFVDSNHKGQYGVEARYDSWLDQSQQWQGNVPSASAPMTDSWKMYLPSPAGHDLVLNLDVPLQYVVEKDLQDAVARYEADGGTIIVEDPRSGAILAMANFPTFDPGHFAEVKDPKVWVDSAVSSIYEPGSVFKLVTMAGALDAGYVTPESRFTDEGALTIDGGTVRNAHDAAYGNVSLNDALAWSINVVSSKVALLAGAPTFYKYVGQFGFGKPTEVDLAAEAPGIVNQPGSPGWSRFSLANNSFGQGISVTPLQMVNSVASVANGGLLMQPEVVRSMVEDGSVHPIPPRLLGRTIQPDAARQLTRMMTYVEDHAKDPRPLPGYRVAGKTGTAEVPTAQGYTLATSDMSFIAFLPAADPQIIVLVKLVQPKLGTWAEDVAIPVFAEVAQRAVQILNIAPDDREPP